MNITDIRIKKINSTGALKALVAITLDDEIVIHEIKVIEGSKGLFVTFPSKLGSDGKFMDIVHPIKTEIRNLVQEKVLEVYNNLD